MGRAQLKSTEHSRLEKLLATRDTAKLGYETTAERGWPKDSFIIRHHGSKVAEIHRDMVVIFHTGYNSITTAHRINTILFDNMVNNSYGRVGAKIKGGIIHLGNDGGRIALTQTTRYGK